MAYIDLVIKIPEEQYNMILLSDKTTMAECASKEAMMYAIKNGTLLPKGHGRLIDADKTISKICGSSCGCHFEECGHDEPCFSVTRIELAPTIVEADKEYEAEVITHGKCMMCGKELTEGLFFCKECGDKANSRK